MSGEVFRTIRNASGKPYCGQQNSVLYHFTPSGPASAFAFPEKLADHLVRQSYCVTEDVFRLTVDEAPAQAATNEAAQPDVVWVTCADCDQKFQAGSEHYAEHISKHELSRKRQPKEEASAVTKKPRGNAE